MAKTIDDKLVLAISSRALFDLSESHKVYLSSGVEAYRQYQIEHEDEILEPGDSIYFESRMGHACVSVGDETAEILWICTQISLDE